MGGLNVSLGPGGAWPGELKRHHAHGLVGGVLEELDAGKEGLQGGARAGGPMVSVSGKAGHPAGVERGPELRAARASQRARCRQMERANAARTSRKNLFWSAMALLSRYLRILRGGETRRGRADKARRGEATREGGRTGDQGGRRVSRAVSSQGETWHCTEGGWGTDWRTFIRRRGRGWGNGKRDERDGRRRGWRPSAHAGAGRRVGGATG